MIINSIKHEHSCKILYLTHDIQENHKQELLQPKMTQVKFLRMRNFIMIYSKTCVIPPLSKRPKIGVQNQLWLNVGQKLCRMVQGEHSAVLSTFIKLPFVIILCLLRHKQTSRTELPFHLENPVSTQYTCIQWTLCIKFY